MRLEKVGSCLATVVTLGSRKQVAERDGVGEDREDPMRHQRLPLPEKPGGQLPAGCGGPLPWRHGGGDAYQELVARVES